MATIAFWGDSLTEGYPGVAYLDRLKAQLPQHTLLNYGKGGDTVRSLYARAKRAQARQPQNLRADAVVLWLGVNDVLPDLASFYPPMKRLVGQPWAKSEAEFREFYRRLIELFHPHCRLLWTVAPLFIGEDMENQWHRCLESQARLIAEVSEAQSSSGPEVRFLDMRAVFKHEFSKLGARRAEIVSQFLPVSPMKAAWDMFFYRTAARADRRAEERGLFFTMDGVHLNSRGAAKVAGAFRGALEQAGL